jgi:death-associated protein kinase
MLFIFDIQEGETPMHCASARGNLDCVRILLDNRAPINVIDRRGCTPLHLACRRHHVSIALLLLHAGTQFDVLDMYHETPLHAAAREGLLAVVQTLCAYGCRLDVVSKAGVTPLHLAARGGHVEVIRCLLLSGAEPDMPNKDGVTAEIMALAQGHSDVAELLTKLKPERREVFMRQLVPTNTPLSRIKVKLFGHSGVGKTTMIDSLKCGYFGSFFRKARLSSSNSVSQQRKNSIENGTVQRHHSLPSQLSYEVTNGSYTKGIDVQQVNISGAGDLSIWDFSGYEPYFSLYDHFIGDPNCIHMVVYSLVEPQNVQLDQVTYWLNFLKARIPPFEPIGK